MNFPNDLFPLIAHHLNYADYLELRICNTTIKNKIDYLLYDKRMTLEDYLDKAIIFEDLAFLEYIFNHESFKGYLDVDAQILKSAEQMFGTQCIQFLPPNTFTDILKDKKLQIRNDFFKNLLNHLKSKIPLSVYNWLKNRDIKLPKNFLRDVDLFKVKKSVSEYDFAYLLAHKREIAIEHIIKANLYNPVGPYTAIDAMILKKYIPISDDQINIYNSITNGDTEVLVWLLEHTQIPQNPDFMDLISQSRFKLKMVKILFDHGYNFDLSKIKDKEIINQLVELGYFTQDIPKLGDLTDL